MCKLSTQFLKKIFITITLLFVTNFLFSQTLYDKDGFSLYYTSSIYNTISVEGNNYYDQYEINVFFKNLSGKPIFTPSVSIEWDKDNLLKKVRKFYTSTGGDGYLQYNYKYIKDSFPQSKAVTRFGFPDGFSATYLQPHPYISGAISQKAPTFESLMLPGNIHSCKMYLLVEANEPLPLPRWNIFPFVYKTNFKKENLKLPVDEKCSCEGSNKPRGNKGDKPKGYVTKSLNNKTDNIHSISPNKSSDTIVKKIPTENELKSLILSNLRKNSPNFEWVNGTNGIRLYKKWTNYKFEIIGNEFHIYFDHESRSELNGKLQYYTTLQKLHGIFKLNKMSGMYLMQHSKEFPDDVFFRMKEGGECKSYYTAYKEIYADGGETEFKGGQLEPYQCVNFIFGYKTGESKKNLNELNQAFRDLYKLLNK